MNLIYTISGKSYEGGWYESVDYKIDGKIYEKSDILSFAIAENRKEKGDNSKVTVFFPLSLFDNELKDEGDLNTKIKIIQDKVKEFPEFVGKEYVSSYPLPSIYVAKKGSETIKFEASYNDILLAILSKMIEDFYNFRSEGKTETLNYIIDINTGQNFYVAQLSEALRYVALFLKLKYWGETEGRFSFSRAFSDPIIGREKIDYHQVYFEDIRVKAFLHNPLDIDTIKKLCKFLEEKMKFLEGKTNRENSKISELEEVLKNSIYVFNALVKNIPLYFFSFGYDSREKIGEKIKYIVDVMRKLSSKYNPHPYKHLGNPEYKIEFANVSDDEKNMLINSLIALALYYNISGELERNGVKKMKEIPLQHILKFEKIYGKYSLAQNSHILGSELENIKELKKGSSWRTISQIKTGSSLPKEKIKIDDKFRRNFIAHCGFEWNITELKEDEEIFVRWRKEFQKGDIIRMFI